MSPMRRRILAAVVVVVAVVLSILEARSQHPGTDFHARWLAGRWFWSGESLYQFLPGVREPTYPPFAPMVFQLFALFPLKVAAGLFYFCNILLIPVAVWLTLDIFDTLWPDRPRERWRLIVAIVLSLQFFLNNLNLVQVNLALFVLCLLGIRAYVRGRDWAAAAALVAATAIKLIPVFLVTWLVVRGRRRAALAVVPLGLACLLLPVVQRGPRAGLRDLREYYQTTLRGFATGGVVQRYTNQNLAAAVFRVMRPPPPEEPERDYRLFGATEQTARATYEVLAALLVASFFGVLVWLRVRAAPLTVFEPSAAFLVGHLLSAMTWKAHLVTLLFVYYAFLSLRWQALDRWERRFVAVTMAFVAIGGLSGRDLFGNTVHHYVGGYSVLVWAMVLLFCGALWFSLPRQPRDA